MISKPLHNPHASSLRKSARELAISPKGILAADESIPTMGKRLSAIKVENSEENRQKYRTLLCTTPGIEQYISGMILNEETVFQKAPDGTFLVDKLIDRGILAGVKVDKGLKLLPGELSQTVTQGLDDLDARCEQFYKQGCRFTKWRAVFFVQEDASGFMVTPSNLAIEENATILARFASISQMNGLVPIVEPEVLMDGDISIDAASQASESVLAAVVKVSPIDNTCRICNY